MYPEQLGLVILTVLAIAAGVFVFVKVLLG